MKISKNRYLAGFAAIVFLLFLIRLIFPSVTKSRGESMQEDTQVEILAQQQEQPKTEKSKSKKEKQLVAEKQEQASQQQEQASEDKKQDSPEKQADPTKKTGFDKNRPSRFFNSDGTVAKHRIWSVARYADAFPDSQQVQIVAANRWGVEPVINRSDAEQRKNELVYVQSSPYYHIDKMYRSIPYLVPRAAVLLNDIGRAYYDSLQIKGIPLHQFIITSVLRTKEDVNKLRHYNGNATENSCHLYGTTFDISYNRYLTVQTADEPRRAVRNDSLKWVLCEVLNDFRKNGRCYIKYEVKQGCFHITVR
ncbi:MAG: hypothetical protein IKH64_06845 [Prevotella sp.]|nr:hypothetical protein [Prevotella sp.]